MPLNGVFTNDSPCWGGEVVKTLSKQNIEISKKPQGKKKDLKRGP
ncbi:hypothetical protein SCG7109_AK_00130 [Chlamydiales bacterium SCGC AG-110-M15]|nr:hypothetical protein SCG7109_AK_00130 [Chlamydiales bacterium SCGC AG-110-M15]